MTEQSEFNLKEQQDEFNKQNAEKQNQINALQINWKKKKRKSNATQEALNKLQESSNILQKNLNEELKRVQLKCLKIRKI